MWCCLLMCKGVSLCVIVNPFVTKMLPYVEYLLQLLYFLHVYCMLFKVGILHTVSYDDLIQVRFPKISPCVTKRHIFKTNIGITYTMYI